MKVFKKYNSIESTYRVKVLDEIYMRGFDAGDWVVTEKVDGSNFSFWMNEEGLRCARRKAFLSITDNFSNWQSVADAYDQHLSCVYQLCKGMLSELEDSEFITVNGDVEVRLYGELFGGKYIHPEVDKVVDAVKIQGSIQYCPWNDFYPFDITINDRYLSYDIFEAIMKETGFNYARVLYRGSLKDCLQFPNDLQSTIPKLLGLPAIENNISEGVVIRPVEAKFFPNGSRVILKNKNDKFVENNGCKVRTKHEYVDKTLEEHEIKVLDKAQEYITESRLHNVLSAICQITDKQFGKLMGLFTQDVLEELQKDCPEMQEWPKLRLKYFHKSLIASTSVFIRKRFLNIIDGTF